MVTALDLALETRRRVLAGVPLWEALGTAALDLGASADVEITAGNLLEIALQNRDRDERFAVKAALECLYAARPRLAAKAS